MGGVANQRVLEGVDRLRRLAPREDQLGRGEPVERGPQLRLRHRRDRREQRVGELAPDAGRRLRHLLDPGHPVQPGHQRGVQRGRHRRRPAARRPGLQHRLGELLDEQRHPVGPGRDLGKHRRGKARGSPAERAAIASVAPRPSRLSVRRVTCGCPPRLG